MKINQRGDTIVEVLLAIVVISVVIAGAYTLTNRATRINQTALEKTTASNILREQIELIRGARTAGADSAVWQAIMNRNTSTQPGYGDCSSPSNSFYINPALNSYTNASFVVPYSSGSVNYSGLYKVWVQGYEPSGTGNDYVDFHVRACWQGIGDQGEQRSSLIMRIAQ